jgi:hypothetical protein
MTLLIACILIYAYKFNWVWYVVASVIWGVTLIIRMRLLSMQDEMHSEIIKKIQDQDVNIIEHSDLKSLYEDLKKIKRNFRNLH